VAAGEELALGEPAPALGDVVVVLLVCDRKFSTTQADLVPVLLLSPLSITCHRHSPVSEAKKVVLVVL
jgi:hypothetical protein